MAGFLQDLTLAFRLMRRSLGYTATAVITLAAGIGAATSIFSVVSGVLLQPLPYPDPDRLLIVRADTKTVQGATLSSREVEALERSGLFDEVGAMNMVHGSLTGEGAMASVEAASATETFLKTLGVTPAYGRHLSAREDIGPDAVTGVIISFELWQRHFGGDPGIIGRPIEVNNLSVRVVGVLPRGFRVHLAPGLDVPPRIDLWFPRGLEGGPLGRGEITVARLKSGVTLAAAAAAMDAMSRRLIEAYPNAYPAGQLTLRPSMLRDDVVRSVRAPLVALMAGVLILLMISCANVAHLALGRGSVRAREMAVRQALGARPGRLLRQLLVESFVLAAMAGLAGLVLAQWGVQILRTAAAAYLPRVDQIAIDPPVLAFAAVVSLGAVVFFGLAPAIAGARSDVTRGLRIGAVRSGGTPGERWFRTALLVTEVALLLVLLVAGGLVLRAVFRLQQVELGFRPEQAVVARVEVSSRLLPDPVQREAFFRRAIDAARSVPGAEAVTTGGPLPLEGGTFTQRYALSDDAGAERRVAARHVAWAGYVKTMGIRLIAGREFTEDDYAARRRVILVDTTIARTLWPTHSGIGQRLFLDPGSKNAGWAEVIGVVDHIHSDTLRGAGSPQLYVPYSLFPLSAMSVVIRTQARAEAIAPALRARLESLGGGRPVHAIVPLTSYVDEETADGRFALFVFGMLGVIGLIIASAGLYGVMAHATAQRTHEIGVRMALGAQPLSVSRLVLRDAMTATLAGIVLGAIAAGVLTRYLEALLFEVSPLDPITFGGVALLLTVTALAASYLPARRAMRVDPMIALRSE